MDVGRPVVPIGHWRMVYTGMVQASKPRAELVIEQRAPARGHPL